YPSSGRRANSSAVISRVVTIVLSPATPAGTVRASHRTHAITHQPGIDYDRSDPRAADERHIPRKGGKSHVRVRWVAPTAGPPAMKITAVEAVVWRIPFAGEVRPAWSPGTSWREKVTTVYRVQTDAGLTGIGAGQGAPQLV